MGVLLSSRLIGYVALGMLTTLSYAQSNQRIIYGVENAKHFVGSESENYYIKLYGFKTEHEAQQIYQYLKTGFISVRVSPNYGSYQVTLGPIYSAHEVREVGSQLSGMMIARAKAARSAQFRQSTYTETPVSLVRYSQPKVIKKGESFTQLFRHPVFTFSGGAAWGSSVERKSLYLQQEIFKIFNPSGSNPSAFVGDFFVGFQYALMPEAVGQIGLSVGATTGLKQTGEIWEQGYSEFNNYTYQYNLSQTHVLIKGKLIIQPLIYQLSPYVSAGVGVGFNRAHGYQSTPKIEEESIQPPFADNTTTDATYALGIGLQRAIRTNWSVGVGYEFSGWGKMMLGRAPGQTINQGLTNTNFYTNGVIANMTYVG